MREEDKQRAERAVHSMDKCDTASAEKPRRITLREHINNEIDYRLSEIERLRRDRNLTPASLLDSYLDDVKHATRLT